MIDSFGPSIIINQFRLLHSVTKRTPAAAGRLIDYMDVIDHTANRI